ncbi:MAG: hypothetical protein HY272_12530 [Gammaproteobacteria bacterium]|nr:hypothetical protein [Gammaproteobacteria bacterium]
MLVTTPRLVILFIATTLAGCGNVPYDPATTTDATAPRVALRVDNAQPSPVEVTNFIPGALQNKNAIANPNANIQLLGTAADDESGIKEIKLSVTRTVKFVASNGGLADAYLGTKVVDTRTFSLNNGQAPTFGAIQSNVKPSDEFVFQNANGNTVTGVGVVLEYNVEAKNFAGKMSYTDRLVVSSGQLQ